MAAQLAAVEVGPPPPPGESRPRRAPGQKDALTTRPFPGIDTIHDVLLYSARQYGNKPAIGWREIEKVIEEEKEIKKIVGGKEVTEKKTWKYFQLSDYKYISYVEFKDKVILAAKGLVKLDVQKGQVFNVYATTSPNWQLVAHSCMAIGTPIATAYDTLGESGLTHSLSEPECVGVFTNADLLPTLTRVLPNTPTVKVVVYDGEPSSKVLEGIRGVREDIKVISLDELINIGKEAGDFSIEDRRPVYEDTSCIMYTSGTTGPPKGVVLTHGNLIASVGAIYLLVGPFLKSTDMFLAFLPLAHILEYIVEITVIFFLGITTGYGRIRTLTDASVRNCLGDLRAFKPTLMVGVPAVFETIRKGIVGRVNKSGAVKKQLFQGALNVKKAGVPVLKQLADAVVFSQIREQTGGQLRLTLCGGAALSRETQEFLTLALVTILQGYGMTESCGMCAIMPPTLLKYGSVGVPVPSVEIKFLDVPEAGYLSTNTLPQGEILIRGPSVTRGYFKRDDLNNDKSIFTEDGWFRTGDVGQWNADGTLTIIDRVKNLVKLQGGEYIALERLESTYKSCNLVSNICVHVIPDAKQPIALIFPHEANLRHALSLSPSIPSTLNTEHADLHTLCAEKAVIDLVLKETNAVGKKSGFKSIEILETVILTPEEWTPENGLVTAAQKLQRKKIAEAYKSEIDMIAANNND